jgi:hypothetical protein
VPLKKTRIPIPDEMATEVMFAADRTCCVCHESGKQVQIHHIDEDPSHNEVDNLTVLCLECHAQTQIAGGFGRKLNANLVRRYRSHWLTLVQLRRNAEALRSEIDHASMEPNVATSFQEEPAPSVGSAPAVQSTPLAEPAPLTDSLHAGENFRNGGIVISIIDVRVSPSVRLNKSGYRAGSGLDVLSDVSAGPGAKYITVQTRVFNDGRGSIDLTCGYPIRNHVIDERGRKFDSIDQLYQIPGNPECNANLQPGFEGDMTWIYRVPAEAEIVGFAFGDISDFSAPPLSPTTVTIHRRSVTDLEA